MTKFNTFGADNPLTDDDDDAAPQASGNASAGWDGEVAPDVGKPAGLLLDLLEALDPFASATLTHTGHIIGLMREDFERARSAIKKARGDCSPPQEEKGR
jgi:hypothetical protein